MHVMGCRPAAVRACGRHPAAAGGGALGAAAATALYPPPPTSTLQGVVEYVAANPDKFSAENIADVVRRTENCVCLVAGWLASLSSMHHCSLCLLLFAAGWLAGDTWQACLSRPLSPCPPAPTIPPPPLQVYAFSRCGFCHPDLITVVETAAGTLLKEAHADRGYVRLLCDAARASWLRVYFIPWQRGVEPQVYYPCFQPPLPTTAPFPAGHCQHSGRLLPRRLLLARRG